MQARLRMFIARTTKQARSSNGMMWRWLTSNKKEIIDNKVDHEKEVYWRSQMHQKTILTTKNADSRFHHFLIKIVQIFEFVIRNNHSYILHYYYQ
jgi:hypothetical protein